jgi:Flp pilus assembly protein TadG
MNRMRPSTLVSALRRRVDARRPNERGYVLIMTALLIVPMLILAAMAVDYGGWYAEGTRMQKAADAAALAGVVWLPNINQATAVAKDTAKQNGYDDALANVTVKVTQISETELGVAITDNASQVYLAKFLKNTTTISRSASAKYVLPVPLGSPKNYFGTGQMISGSDRENFFGAVNGYCSYKAQGGPFEARWMIPGIPSSSQGSGNACTGSHATNDDYRSDPDPAYQYYIELPPNRTQTMRFYIYNPHEDADDPTGYSSSQYSTTSFWLQAPDNTPFNDSDNKIYGQSGSGGSCTGSGESNPRTYTASDNDATFFSQSGWSGFCTFTTSAPAGKYILNVRTKEGESNSYATNAFSFLVQRGTSTSTATVCDTRTDTTCPSIYGKSWMSIYANASGSSANFFLAKIGPEHEGKTLKITLFDPGEGGKSIRILDPAGNYANFRYQDMGVDGDVPGTQYGPTSTLTVTGGVYNGKFVELTIDLPGNYASNTAYKNAGWWWKIQYNTDTGTVTDRTTWGVRVIGDPVHLTS